MYAFIKGKLVQRKEEFIVVENNGIGYKIHCLQPVQEQLGRVDEVVCVYTYLYVREDTFALYGFSSQESHDLFVMLLQVSGVGPKVALTLVAALSPSQFALAVITGDVKVLTQVKGIGKKGAERLIVELKDKLKGYSVSAEDVLAGGDSIVPAGGSVAFNEAVSALVVLGYPGHDAQKAVSAVYQDELKLEELIRLALRRLV